jgi:hypothetical protein
LHCSKGQTVSYEALVACKGGHLRTTDDPQTRFGEELPTRCRCGAEFITECPSCKEEIREGSAEDRKSGDDGEVILPKYCTSCGNPYPWTLNISKGQFFEAFVCKLFPRESFDVVHATTNRNDLCGRRVWEAEEPDFRFRHRPSGHFFWVECKYRTALYDGKIKWAERWQMERYQRFQRLHRPEKVYVVIGFGGEPGNPESLYSIPLDEIQYPRLFPTYIEKYSRSVTKEFEYLGGRLK